MSSTESYGAERIERLEGEEGKQAVSSTESYEADGSHETQEGRSYSTRQPTGGYRKLLAFQAAHELVIATHNILDSFPKKEQYGLASQMRRAAVSVAANIVEGHALDTTPQFVRHLAISFGSCKELEYYYDLAYELGYLDHAGLDRARSLEGRAAYLIGRLLQSLRARMVKESPATYSLDSLDSEDTP